MSAVFGIVFPIYAAILIGFCLVKFKVFQTADMRIFGTYVLNVALPALIFQAVASRSISEVLYVDYLLPYLLGGLALSAFVYKAFAFQKAPPTIRALAAFGSICPNNGFIGYAVMLLVAPELAGLILALNFMVENLIFVPAHLALLEGAKNKRDISFWRKLQPIFINLLKMPLLIGLLLGIVVSMSGLTLPAPVNVLASMLAASASALALVVIGGTLAEVKATEHHTFALQIIGAKLLLHPLLTIAIATGLNSLGLIDLKGDFLIALALSAGMPIFAVYAVFGQRAGHAGLSSVALVGSTTGALLSLSILLYLLT